MTRDIDLARLPESIHDSVRELVELLIRLAGHNLRGIALYRPVPTDGLELTSPVRSIAILGGMDLPMLDQLRHAGGRFRRNRLRAPLIMTPRSIDESLDTFPLELLEIQQLHIMVFGPDVFAALQFEPQNVRLQAERELKRSLIHLRQGLLASAGRDRLLAPLCREALEHILRVLRGILWLKDKPCPDLATSILQKVEETTPIPLVGLRDALGRPARSDFVWFQRFYRDVERLSDYVDAWRV